MKEEYQKKLNEKENTIKEFQVKKEINYLPFLAMKKK